MTDYEKGLEKLGLWQDGPQGHQSKDCPIDLRTDPAFAWRVLEACRPNILGADGPLFHPEAWLDSDDFWHVRFDSWRLTYRGPTLADALYAAVEALGRASE